VFANDGSAVAPAYAFDYDHSVGMYRYGAGVLGFSALETNTFRIDSTGVTVIGGLTLGGVGRTNWPSSGGDVYLANNNVFTGTNTLGDVIIAPITIPNRTTSVGNYAYANTAGTQPTLTMPQHLTGDMLAFNGVKLYSLNLQANITQPTAATVKKGTVYGTNNGLTGTLAGGGEIIHPF
jgi:hypothetical protein